MTVAFDPKPKTSVCQIAVLEPDPVKLLEQIAKCQARGS
jgi:hypothetical protein